MNLKISFTDKEITPWGGISLMKKMLDKIQFEEVLKSLPLPEQGSNRGYKPEQLLQHLMIGVWCGANCFEHLEVTRHDEVIRKLFCWDRMAGSKAFQRYMNKFTQVDNQIIFNGLYRWFFDNLQFDNYTLDFDSTILTRYGEQEGAKKGYNPSKPGRKSQHPLMAFISDIRMVANCWLRSGNTSAANNFLSFIEDTLIKIGNKKVGVIRADSGFHSAAIFDYIESKDIAYVISAKFYPSIKAKLASEKTWLKLDNGLEIADTMYQAEGWEKARRIVMIRQHIRKRPKAVGKQLCMFEGDLQYKNYRYSCYITNMELPPKVVYDIYRGRADCENRIKELKYDFGAATFKLKNFWATEAVLNFIMIAYNLMSLFRQAVLGNSKQQFLKTIRYKTFAIGGYLIKKGNSRVLKLSLAMKRRQWFKGLWNTSDYLDSPFLIYD
jgi:hypothetical protein